MTFLDFIAELEIIYKLKIETDYTDIDKPTKNLETYIYKSIAKVFHDKLEMFRLYWIEDSTTQKESVLVSFHVDVLNSDAIQWYSRLKVLYPKLLLTESYIYDDYNVIYTGSVALKILQARNVQDAAKYYQEKKKPVVGLESVEIDKLTFIDPDLAYQKFFSSPKPKNDDDIQ